MGTCQELGNQPERLGLDVLDHDGVHELPPAVVRAEPAAHVPVPLQQRVHGAAQVEADVRDEGQDVAAREGAGPLACKISYF